MKKEDLKTKAILPPPPPSHGRQDMGLKTHTGQANPNPNIKAQENTLSAKPLSPFKPKSAVKPSQTKPVLQTQTEPIPKSQIVGLSKPKQSQTKEPQPLSPSQEPTLSPSRRQFIEQYGAYALVTPVALYAMMSPNRAMAQAASVGVIDTRPRVLNNQDRIETFDIDTIVQGFVDVDGDLTLIQDEYYTTSDGTVYTCVLDYCYISPTPEEGGGKASYSSVFSISYSDDGADFVGPSILTGGDTMENFDISTHTDGSVVFGDLELSKGQKYTAADGIAYSCTTELCIILSTGELFPGTVLIGAR